MTCLSDAVGELRAQVVGLGLLGGSVALALRRVGWHVTGIDVDAAGHDRALGDGIVDAIGEDFDADLVVVCTPVATIPPIALYWLERSTAVVTDVGSTKREICSAVQHRRFLGGHPMAGSELSGLDGADAHVFTGAVWVVTPSPLTTPETMAMVHSVAVDAGADVVVLAPEDHDAIVAAVSHVPHLVAGSLMAIAARRNDANPSVLRLAAGGFRDMTRIAAGDVEIWPDICQSNRSAITEVLDELIDALTGVRARVHAGDRAELLDMLEHARDARRNLPTTVPVAGGLAELRVVIADRPGSLAAVTQLASQLGVNIYDIEVAHSAEGPAGVLILVVQAERAVSLQGELREAGFPVTTRVIS
jgi:prephenate dehydrogenase